MTKRPTTRGWLRYDAKTDRFRLYTEGRAVPVYCGEGLALRFRDGYIWGRIEMDSRGDWYVIFTVDDETSTALNLRRGSSYDALICC